LKFDIMISISEIKGLQKAIKRGIFYGKIDRFAK